MAQSDLIVIGAGPFGLIAAHTWLELHPDDDILILEAGPDLGGVWSNSRVYSTMMTQTPVGMLEYACYPMEPLPKSETYHDYFPASHVGAYLSKFSTSKTFADRNLLQRIAFDSPVKHITKSLKWTVETTAGSIYHTRKLILATGRTSLPSLPQIPSADSSKFQRVIHSKDLATNTTHLQDPSINNVLVIGGSKSAYDTIQFLHSLPNNPSTTLLIRPTGNGLGPPILATPNAPWPLSNSHEILSMRLVSKTSPCIFEEPDKWARFWHGRNVVGIWLCDVIWRVVDWMWRSAARYERSPGMKMLVPERKAFWTGDGVAVYNSEGMWDSLARAKVMQDEIEELRDSEVILKSGERVKCDAIIAATGWKNTFPMFDHSMARSLGLPISLPIQGELSIQEQKAEVEWNLRLEAADIKVISTFPRLANQPSYNSRTTKSSAARLYRAMVPVDTVEDDHSIAFLGTVGTTQSFTVAEIQALWTCAYLSGKLNLPSKKEMEDNVALAIAWRKRRYVGDGETFIYEQLQYQSMLLRDLGLNDLRKGGGWREILMPYASKDYKGILGEWKRLVGWEN